MLLSQQRLTCCAQLWLDHWDYKSICLTNTAEVLSERQAVCWVLDRQTRCRGFQSGGVVVQHRRRLVPFHRWAYPFPQGTDGFHVQRLCKSTTNLDSMRKASVRVLTGATEQSCTVCSRGVLVIRQLWAPSVKFLERCWI